MSFGNPSLPPSGPGQDTGLGQTAALNVSNPPVGDRFSRPSRGIRRQLTGPKLPATGSSEGHQDGSQNAHELSRASGYPMHPPPRMASIPESPRAALPSADELRWANRSAKPQPSLSQPSVEFLQQPGPGRGAGFARASTPARGPYGSLPPATPASPWATHEGAPHLHGTGTPVVNAVPNPPSVRTHGPPFGPPPAVSSYGIDPPMATVSLVAGPCASASRSQGPNVSSTPLSQPAFGALHGQHAGAAGHFARQSLQGPLGGPHAAGTRPVQFQAAELDKPGKGGKGALGPSSAGTSGSSSSEHLRAIGLLCQAAAITGTSSSLSNQHLRSMRMLCQAYLSGELMSFLCFQSHSF